MESGPLALSELVTINYRGVSTTLIAAVVVVVPNDATIKRVAKDVNTRWVFFKRSTVTSIKEEGRDVLTRCVSCDGSPVDAFRL